MVDFKQKMLDRVVVREVHINWLVDLQSASIFKKLDKWKQNFVCDLALRIEQGQNTLSPAQEAKLRQVAYDFLVE